MNRLANCLCVFSLLLLANCASIVEPTACDAKTELQCLKSAACKVQLVENRKYVCRPAAGRCEMEFVQWSGGKQSCESINGCKHVPHRCYCPPDVTCRCGGGAPQNCVDAEQP